MDWGGVENCPVVLWNQIWHPLETIEAEKVQLYVFQRDSGNQRSEVLQQYGSVEDEPRWYKRYWSRAVHLRMSLFSSELMCLLYNHLCNRIHESNSLLRGQRSGTEIWAGTSEMQLPFQGRSSMCTQSRMFCLCKHVNKPSPGFYMNWSLNQTCMTAECLCLGSILITNNVIVHHGLINFWMWKARSLWRARTPVSFESIIVLTCRRTVFGKLKFICRYF